MEEGDFEDRNMYSKHFEKKLQERSSLREARELRFKYRSYDCYVKMK